MSVKVITKSCKTTQLTIYGINPNDVNNVKSVNYLYNGDFATATEKDKERIKNAVVENNSN